MYKLLRLPYCFLTLMSHVNGVFSTCGCSKYTFLKNFEIYHRNTAESEYHLKSICRYHGCHSHRIWKFSDFSPKKHKFTRPQNSQFHKPALIMACNLPSQPLSPPIPLCFSQITYSVHEWIAPWDDTKYVKQHTTNPTPFKSTKHT